MLDRFENSDGLGAIFPPMIWSIVALRSLGYADDSPELKYCHERLDGLLIEEGDMIRLQPCKSPVWDTSITLRALAASGLPAQHEAFASGIRWLLDRASAPKKEIGPKRTAPNQAAGASNMPTRFIPTSTTRRWC